jgi:hypothetical protein
MVDNLIDTIMDDDLIEHLSLLQNKGETAIIIIFVNQDDMTSHVIPRSHATQEWNDYLYLFDYFKSGQIAIQIVSSDVNQSYVTSWM